MRKMIRKAKEGFTLIELMIVVAIVGVLAVLAIYGVRKYIASAKTAEARNMLGQIKNDVSKAYSGESMQSTVLGQGSSTAVTHSLCGSAAATVPSTATNIKGKKYKSTTAEWNADQAGNSGFACLHFVIDDPQYFMYGYAITGAGNASTNTWTGTANGDLNGDGVLSTFTITGSLGTDLILNNAPSIAEVNPDE